jgi:hypothetical protein
MKNYYCITLLQSKILQAVGLSEITTAKVAKVVDAIEQKLQERISESTLQRFFNLIPVTSNFTNKTLDILANFVGYASWDNFCLVHQEYHQASASPSSDSSGSILFKICLNNFHIESVLEFINALPIPIDKSQESYNSKCVFQQEDIATIIGRYCHKSPKLAKALLPKLAKTIAGQFIFYESYVSNYPFYLDAIEQYYFPNIHIKNPLFGIRDTVFAYSMMITKYLEQNKPKKAYKLGSELLARVQPESIAKDNTNLKPWIRYYIHRLYFLSKKGSLSQRELDRILCLLAEECTGSHAIFTLKILSEIMREIGMSDIFIEFFESYESKFQDDFKNNTLISSSDWHSDMLLSTYANAFKYYQEAGYSQKAMDLSLKIKALPINQEGISLYERNLPQYRNWF